MTCALVQQRGKSALYLLAVRALINKGREAAAGRRCASITRSSRATYAILQLSVRTSASFEAWRRHAGGCRPSAIGAASGVGTSTALRCLYGIAHFSSDRIEPVVSLDGTAVLVVEDEPLILFAICDDLGDLGLRVFEASNAKLAIEQLILHPEIDVLFTDIDMPGDMDGLALAKLVRGRWPPIKIIITSGKHWFTREDLPVIGRFIPKPYDPTSVASAIREMTAV